MKQLILSMIVALLVYCVPVAHADQTMFKIQAVDTMKYSRDAARNESVTKQIPKMVALVAEMHPTHIALGTPYDEEFYPVLKLWVLEARKHNLNVWFRGNMSAWEGWFDRKKYRDPLQHHADIAAFIQKHPDLFAKGDIFTPAPEPENGGFGDPRTGEEIKKKFFDFLPESYRNCRDAFARIGIEVTCGYFSTNGDVAKIIPTYVYQQSGGVQVIDHYVRTPEELIRDIQALYAQNHLPIVLGEFGLPIPDIHGSLSDNEQNRLIEETLSELAKHRTIVHGMNYWTAFGGSTKIFSDNLEPKPAVKTIAQYFSPVHVYGRVLDEWDEPVGGVNVQVEGLSRSVSTSLGEYSVLTLSSNRKLTAKKDGYITTRMRTPFSDDRSEEQVDIHIIKRDRDFWERVLIFLHRFGLTRKPASS